MSIKDAVKRPWGCKKLMVPWGSLDAYLEKRRCVLMCRQITTQLTTGD